MGDDLETLWGLCRACFEDPSLAETVVIIDALDECNESEKDQLMRWIRNVLKCRSDQSLEPLKVIITSRPDTYPTNQLDSMTTILDLYKETEAVGRDVDLFIDAQISELAATKRIFEHEAQDWLRKHLRTHSGKTFLWVASAFQQLERRTLLSRADLMAYLKDIPPDLSGIYDQSLSRIPEQSREVSKSLLCMITVSKRPLSVSELWASAISSTHRETGGANEDVLRDLCGYMIDISSGKVFFKHRTFQDFLTSDFISKSTKPWYAITESEASIQMMQCCIRQIRSLLKDAGKLPPTPRTVSGLYDLMKSKEVKLNWTFFSRMCIQNPFFAYARVHLAEHFSGIETQATEETLQHMQDFYFDDAAFALWCRGYWSERALEFFSDMSELFQKIFHVSAGTLKDEDVINAMAKYENRGFEFSASPIRMMSRNRHTRLFQRVIKQNPAYCREIFSDGWTALHTVIDMNQMSSFEYIFDNGAEINSLALGSAPIHLAILTQNIEIIHKLLDKDAEVDIQDSRCMTPLHLAALLGQRQTAGLLLSNKARVDMLDRSQETPLHKAASQGHLQVVTLLEGNGSNVRARNKNGEMPLLKAIEAGEESVVRFLVTHMTKEDLQDSVNAFLHAAVRVKGAKIVTLLLEAGIDVQIRDKRGKHGRTAFSYISEHGDKSIHEALLDRGADVNTRDPQGVTLIHKFAAANDLPTMQYLLDRRADINSCTEEGDTILHYAASHGGRGDVYRFLLDRGANIEARNKLGETPLHKAVEFWRSQTTIRLLRERNANIEVRNYKGQTPLQIAIQDQNAGLTVCLLALGARFDVLTIEGHGLLHLAEASFLEHFTAYRRLKIQRMPYRVWLQSGFDNKIFRDDNCFQKFSGSLEEVTIQKIDCIKEALIEVGAKTDPPPQSKPKRRASTSELLNVHTRLGLGHTGIL